MSLPADVLELMDAHLNVSWLRPDNVVWDTIASWHVGSQSFSSPSLDLGAGNGIFSFISAGGRFGIGFDWFVQADPAPGSSVSDIYNAPPKEIEPSILRRPSRCFDAALDHKINLLNQAALLNFYKRFVAHDAESRLPFFEGEFKSIFSNILYWLKNPLGVLRDCARILSSQGRLILCVPDPLFFEFGESYRWKELGSDWLRSLNGTRADCIQWTATPQKMDEWARQAGFQVMDHKSYLQRRTLAYWDMTLRETTRPLLQTVNQFSLKNREFFKKDWIEAVRVPLQALMNEEMLSKGPGAFHLFVLEKKI